MATYSVTSVGGVHLNVGKVVPDKWTVKMNEKLMSTTAD